MAYALYDENVNLFNQKYYNILRILESQKRAILIRHGVAKLITTACAIIIPIRYPNNL